jgi:serine/threonine protein kinase
MVIQKVPMEPEVIRLCRESVADRLQRSGPLPWEQSVRISATVADSLAVSHQRGQVHGRVSPQHVLLGENDRALLCGFVETSGPTTCPQSAAAVAVAALLHTAPEVLDGDPPQPASDIYSLAATLHHLLTGHPPFPLRAQDTFASWFVRTVTHPAPTLPGHLPPGLRRLVGQGLATDRTDRPAGAAEFAAGLRRLLPGDGTRIPPRRHPRLP